MTTELGIEIIALDDWLDKIKESDIPEEVSEDDLFADPKNEIKEQGTLF